MPDEIQTAVDRRDLPIGGQPSPSDAARRQPAKRALEDDAGPVPAKRPRLSERHVENARIRRSESVGSQESELELVPARPGPPERFRVNSRKIGGRQILEKTPVARTAPLVTPPVPSVKEREAPLHWSQQPPRHDLGVYSHNMTVDLDFHGLALERAGLSKALAYQIRRQGGAANVYGLAASPDVRPFMIAADHEGMRQGDYQMMPAGNAFVLLGRQEGKPVYGALMQDSVDRLTPLECRFLGFGTKVPERHGVELKEPNDHRPSFSRNFALLSADDKSALVYRHGAELLRKPVGFKQLATKLAARMRLSEGLVANARLGAPLLLNEHEAMRLSALGKISVPPQSNLCLLVDTGKGPAYTRLNTYQSGKFSERELYRLGFEPPWTQGLTPQERYQLGLLPPGSKALADAVKDEAYLQERGRQDRRSVLTRTADRTGAADQEEGVRSRDRSRYSGR